MDGNVNEVRLDLESECAICMGIMIKPVTMPCKHSLCLACYLQHVEKTSLQCPFCRKRIGTRARKASTTNSLVNESKWQAIQEAFPVKVKLRLEGIEDEVYDEDQE